MTPRLRLQPEAVGVGMTSQRVRDRLVERLREAGIADERVLNAIRTLPRHLFVDEALAIVARNGGRFQLPEILRIKAGLLAEADGSVEGSVEAEQIYRQALAAARSQMAAFAEMRATAALAGHLRRSGRADEADELISAAEPLTAQLPAIWSEIRALAAI